MLQDFIFAVQFFSNIKKIEAVRQSLDERYTAWEKAQKENEDVYLDPPFWGISSLPIISHGEALQSAIKYNNTEYAIWLLDNFGADCLKTTYWHEQPILHHAVSSKNVMICNKIIAIGKTTVVQKTDYCSECEQKLFINQYDPSDLDSFRTVLHIACNSDNISVELIKVISSRCKL